jgi:hypothetical protein
MQHGNAAMPKPKNDIPLAFLGQCFDCNPETGVCHGKGLAAMAIGVVGTISDFPPRTFLPLLPRPRKVRKISVFVGRGENGGDLFTVANSESNMVAACSEKGRNCLALSFSAPLTDLPHQYSLLMLTLLGNATGGDF